MEKNSSKGMNLIQKLYRYRLKIDRKGTPIVNLSSLFCIPCLILAPHMSIAGIILSLVLGYHIRLEAEGDVGDLEETVRAAAEKVKQTVGTATKTIREEIEKNREGAKETPKAEPVQAAPAAEPVAEPAAGPANDEPIAAEPVREPAAPAAPVIDDVLKQMEPVFRGNTAFTACGASVPTLQVNESDAPAEETSAPKAGYQG